MTPENRTDRMSASRREFLHTVSAVGGLAVFGSQEESKNHLRSTSYGERKSRRIDAVDPLSPNQGTRITGPVYDRDSNLVSGIKVTAYHTNYDSSRLQISHQKIRETVTGSEQEFGGNYAFNFEKSRAELQDQYPGTVTLIAKETPSGDSSVKNPSRRWFGVTTLPSRDFFSIGETTFPEIYLVNQMLAGPRTLQTQKNAYGTISIWREFASDNPKNQNLFIEVDGVNLLAPSTSNKLWDKNGIDVNGTSRGAFTVFLPEGVETGDERTSAYWTDSIGEGYEATFARKWHPAKPTYSLPAFPPLKEQKSGLARSEIYSSRILQPIKDSTRADERRLLILKKAVNLAAGGGKSGKIMSELLEKSLEFLQWNEDRVWNNPIMTVNPGIQTSVSGQKNMVSGAWSIRTQSIVYKIPLKSIPSETSSIIVDAKWLFNNAVRYKQKIPISSSPRTPGEGETVDQTNSNAKTNLRSIAFGETKTGEIDPNDPIVPELNRERHGEPVTFEGTAGDELTIDVNTESAKLEMLLRGPENRWTGHVATGEDGGTGLFTALQASGQHTVWVFPKNPDTFGKYNFSLKKTGSGHDLPKSQPINESLSQSDVGQDNHWDIYSYYSNGNETVEVTVESNDFIPGTAIFTERSNTATVSAAGNDKPPTSTASLTYSFSEEGLKQITVYSVGDQTTGDYTLSFEDGQKDENQNGGQLTAPFTEEFRNGLNGWTVDLHEDAGARVSKGEGSWSEKYGGSIRLYVNGGPNHIGVYRPVNELREGMRIIANYESSNLAGSPGGPRIFLHTPDGSKHKIDADPGGQEDTDGRLAGTVPKNMPEGTEVEVRLGVWPGEITVFVKNISVR